MKTLNCDIKIGKYFFDYVIDCFVEKSINNLTSSAVLSLPKKLQFNSGNLKKEILKGDEVVIKVGYDGKVNTLFEGFITTIQTNIPLEIKAEDLMWKLKQVRVNISSKKGELLSEFVSRALPGFQIDCFELEMPNYIVNDKTGAQFLDMLKSDFRFLIFIRNNSIIIGKQYDAQNYKKHKIKLNYDNATENLEYKSKDEIKLKLILISNLDNGKKIEFEYGEDGGDTRTLNFYNYTLEMLKSIAKVEYERLIFDGFRGTLTLYGEPFVEHGDVLEIEETEDSDKNGNYWIDSVNYSFGIRGYRQEAALGART